MVNASFLRTFVTLTETRHFTETAKILNMTQPGVSQHLKWLEDYYGTDLILREGRKFVLTEAGQRVREFAEDLFAKDARFRNTLLSDDPYKGHCRIASPGSYGLFLHEKLIKLKKRHEDLVCDLRFAPNPTVINGVLDNSFDLGFATQRLDHPLLHFKSFAKEELKLVCPKTRERISYAQLKRWGFVSHPDGAYYASRLLSANFPKEFSMIDEFDESWMGNQISLLLEPVAEGMGFTVLPDHAVQQSPFKDQIRIANLEKSVTDTIYLVTRRDKELSLRYNTVLDFLLA